MKTRYSYIIRLPGIIAHTNPTEQYTRLRPDIRAYYKTKIKNGTATEEQMEAEFEKYRQAVVAIGEKLAFVAGADSVPYYATNEYHTMLRKRRREKKKEQANGTDT